MAINVMDTVTDTDMVRVTGTAMDMVTATESPMHGKPGNVLSGAAGYDDGKS